jgi:hypothetical protein
VTSRALEVRAGGAPAPAELAAIAAAVAVVEAERSAAVTDALPPAYRSAWRRAGIHEALEAGARP